MSTSPLLFFLFLSFCMSELSLACDLNADCSLWTATGMSVSRQQGLLWNGKWYGMEGECWYGVCKMLRINGRFEKWNER